MEQGTDALGIVYRPESIDLLALVGAARGRWPLVWIVDADSSALDRRVLKRFGQVVDATGRAPAAVAEDLRALGVTGMTGFCDEVLVELARYAAALGVPANSVATATCLVDKLAERQRLAARGVPGPRFHRIDPTMDIGQIAHRLADLAHPVVIKPARGTGGRHTTCAATLSDVLADCAAMAERGSDAFLIEECLGSYPPESRDGVGAYVSVEVLASAAGYQVVAVTGRMPQAPPFRETGFFIPSGLSADTLAGVEALALDALAALEFSLGMAHVEIQLTPAGPRMIEVNGRLGGGGVPEMLVSLGAGDPYALACAVAMGETPQVTGPPSDAGVAFTFWVQAPMGQASALCEDWADQLAQIPAITETRVRALAHTPSLADGAYGYLLLVRGIAADRAELLAAHAATTAVVEPAQVRTAVTV